METFIASFGGPPGEIVLDVDATDDAVHGHQEGRFFHGYYDHYCFLPLYVLAGDHLLVAYLRPAGIDPAKHSLGILRLLVGRLRQAWPEARIIVRTDSGFCRWRLMNWCERHGVGYITGLARNDRLATLAEPEMAAAAAAFEASGVKHRRFAELRYGATTWDRARRVPDNGGYLSNQAMSRSSPTRASMASSARRRSSLRAGQSGLFEMKSSRASNAGITLALRSASQRITLAGRGLFAVSAMRRALVNRFISAAAKAFP